MEALGVLMDASHKSCDQMYECSCPALEQLRAAAKSAKAIGSRLTGAGWGGCTVSLVRNADVPQFVASIKEVYYKPNVRNGSIEARAVEGSIFSTLPASGAAVLRLKL